MEKKTNACRYVLALFVAAVILGACAVPALAQVTYLEHGNAGGNVVIDISSHQPAIRIRVLHYDWATNIRGASDELTISLRVGSSTWIPVAVMVDSPAQAKWEKELFAGLLTADNLLVVKNWELQVSKVGKIAFAYWTEPLTATITGTGPFGPWAEVFGVSSVTLPPGALIIIGSGDATLKQSITPVPSGYTVQTDYKQYAAQATFVCPAWHYYGPIGSASAPTTFIPDITFTATK
jgi:hypothetical protein